METINIKFPIKKKSMYEKYEELIGKIDFSSYYPKLIITQNVIVDYEDRLFSLDIPVGENDGNN